MTVIEPSEALLEQMGTGLLPQLPKDVYEDRFARARQLMQARDLKVLVVYSGAMEFQHREWARYFANYVHPYWMGESFVIIPLESDPVFLINLGYMVEPTRASSPIRDVRAPIERFGASSRYHGLATALRDILEEKGVERGPIGTVFEGGQGDFTPHPLRRLFDETFAGVKVVDANDLIWELTLVKTPFDIQMIRKASEIASDALQESLNALHEGGREYEAYLEFQRGVLERGADTPLFHYIMQSGIGAHLALRPLAATGRRLKRGELVIIDVGICYQGYYADLSRSAVIGEPTPAGRRLYQATAEVCEEMVATLRPGTRTGDIADTLLAGVRRRGYSRTHVLIGHGIGHSVNEPPFVMPWNDFILKENMVINLEPGIYDPEVGGVRIEDPYLITRNGAERISTITKDLHIA